MRRPCDEKPGDVYGRYTVVRHAGKNKHGHSMLLCRCVCGELRLVDVSNLRGGNAKSCGCLQREVTGEINRTHGHTRHGKRTAEYQAFRAMHSRCENPNNKNYADYGGRGISVCDRWSQFEAFLEDMGTRPDGMTLERINNEKGYSKDNCKWATRKEQSLNQRSNHWIEINGVRKQLSVWADESGVNIGTLLSRIKAGWPAEELLKKSNGVNRVTIEINGVSKSLYAWSREFGILNSTVVRRWNRGLRGQDLFTK